VLSDLAVNEPLSFKAIVLVSQEAEKEGKIRQDQSSKVDDNLSKLVA